MKLLLPLLCSAVCLTNIALKNSSEISSAAIAVSQTDTTIHEFTTVHQMPKFKGGMQKYYQKVASNLEYPKEAKAAGHKGRVFLSFIVELDGSISNIKVMRKLGRGCDEAAVAAIKKTPFEGPAYKNEKPVRMLLNMPVSFGI